MKNKKWKKVFVGGLPDLEKRNRLMKSIRRWRTPLFLSNYGIISNLLIRKDKRGPIDYHKGS
ncbi:MAG TPA: hypothetical protein ENI23_16155 [bacterium]|nr:hypothetical protein [bacterium]